MAAELEPSTTIVAYPGPALPFRQMGPHMALARIGRLGEVGAPLLGSPAGRLGSDPRGMERGRGRASGRKAGLSFVRGFARRGGDSRWCGSPWLALWEGRASAPGRRGLGLREPEGARGPEPRALQKPLLQHLGLQSLPPRPLPRSLSTAPPPSAPTSFPWPCAQRAPGLPGGPARAGRWWRGKGAENRPPAERFQRAAREEGSLRPTRVEPFVPARSLHAGTVTAAGREDGGAAGPAAQRKIEPAAYHAAHGEAAAGWGLLAAGEVAPTAHGTQLPEGPTNFLSAGPEAGATKSHLPACGEATSALRARGSLWGAGSAE